MSSGTTDQRTTSQTIRQWEKVEQIKRSLVKAGLLSGDATPAIVLAKVREVISADLFS